MQTLISRSSAKNGGIGFKQVRFIHIFIQTKSKNMTRFASCGTSNQCIRTTCTIIQSSVFA